MLQRIVADVRFSVKTLLKQPRFTMVAVLTLALGIGAVTAIFSVVNGVLLEPLRYPNAARLVNIWSTAPGLGYDRFPLSPDLFFQYRDQSTAFEDMALVQFGRSNLAHTGEPESVPTAVTTSGYFSTLGASFAHGRPFRADEDLPTSSRVAVVSDRLWKRAFAADPAVVGRVVRLNGEPTEIVGVAPSWLDRESSPDVWTPARFDPKQPPTGSFGWNAVGRLKPGVTPENAALNLAPLVGKAMEAMPGNSNYRAFLTDGKYRPIVHAMREDVVGDVRAPLWILLGTVGMVLIIACANVLNLCLIRADGRQREFAVRLALGGSRGALARALLVESLVLAVAGAAIGVALAAAGMPLLLRLAPSTIPRLDEVAIDARVVAVAAGAALISTVIVGLVPAIRYTRPGLLASLRQGGRGATNHPSRHRGRYLLVAGQTALAMILLVGSGLLARSFGRLMAADAGFDPANVLTARIALPATAYRDDADIARFTRELVDRLAELPSVEAAGATGTLPIDSGSSGTAFEFDGRPTEPGRLPPIVHYATVTPGFFSAMHIRMARGRQLSWDDGRADVRNLVVSQSAADQYWPGEDPIGKRVRRLDSDASTPPPWFTVVGVVRSVRHNGLREAPPSLFYFPPQAGFDDKRTMTYVVRGPDIAAQADAIRRTVRALDPDLPIAGVQTMDEIVSRSIVQFSFTMLTLGIAAAVALILGAVGLYSVLSYAVSLRTREIGVRLALGAQPSRVMRTIVLRGLGTSAIGLVVGAAGAAALTRLLGNLLFETAPLDPLTFVAMALLLAGVAIGASYLPARRAAFISPMESMRGSD